KISKGEAIGTLALAEGPGKATASKARTTYRNGVLNGEKLPVPDGLAANFAIVVAQTDRGIGLVLADLGHSGVVREAVQTLDDSRKQARLAFANVPGELLGAPGDGERLLKAIEQRAAILLAFEQVGGAQRCLEAARDYALERYAFGRPIGSFQAIKHKLADMYVGIELARSNAYYGAWALSKNAPQLALAAATARVSANEAFYFAAKENIQVHGGMGFTWAFDCHLYYRRAKVLAIANGSTRIWKERLVQELGASNAPA
ncbi:MAG: acyl-CoA dehydrogenase, partial [Proteobacteria bacterium]|nr:acyl-CoA dehydrogenase [Pseudomonadota bacterium]